MKKNEDCLLTKKDSSEYGRGREEVTDEAILNHFYGLLEELLESVSVV